MFLFILYIILNESFLSNLKSIPFWVQVCAMLLHFLTKRMVTQIDLNLGQFFKTDFEGDGAIMVDYVRIRLFWNIDTPLRFQRIFQFGDEASVLKFQYDKLRNFCKLCEMMTQDVSECSTNTKHQSDVPRDDNEDSDNLDDQHPDFPGDNDRDDDIQS